MVVFGVFVDYVRSNHKSTEAQIPGSRNLDLGATAGRNAVQVLTGGKDDQEDHLIESRTREERTQDVAGVCGGAEGTIPATPLIITEEDLPAPWPLHQKQDVMESNEQLFALRDQHAAPILEMIEHHRSPSPLHPLWPQRSAPGGC